MRIYPGTTLEKKVKEAHLMQKNFSGQNSNRRNEIICCTNLTTNSFYKIRRKIVTLP